MAIRTHRPLRIILKSEGYNPYRDSGGKFASGPHSIAHAALHSLNDPAFAQRHEERLTHAVLNTVRQETPQEAAHRAQQGHRPLPPHLAEARRVRHAQQDIETVHKERAAIENEHAARAAGHLRDVPRAAADAYPAVRDASRKAVGDVQTRLLGAHRAAAKELSSLHALDHEGQLDATREAADHFARTHEGLSELSGVGVNHDFDDHEDDVSGGASDEAGHGHADAFRAQADRAQAALEALHEHHGKALSDLRSAEKAHERASGAVRREIENVDPSDLVNHKAFKYDEHGDPVPEHAHAWNRAMEAARSLSDYEAARRDEMTEGLDFSDSTDGLREETKATERAIKELSKHSGRAHTLGKKQVVLKKSSGEGSRMMKRIYDAVDRTKPQPQVVIAKKPSKPRRKRPSLAERKAAEEARNVNTSESTKRLFGPNAHKKSD